MLTMPVFLMILFSVSCSAFAQILLKHGMAQPGMQQVLADGHWWSIMQSIATDPSIWSGLFLYGLSALIWLFVLARLDVSVAYTFVALGFLITMALGCLIFGEAFTLRKVLGTLVVAVGVYLVAAN
jgi:drug/metabolite transporter (DMT)-like permease